MVSKCCVGRISSTSAFLPSASTKRQQPQRNGTGNRAADQMIDVTFQPRYNTPNAGAGERGAEGRGDAPERLGQAVLPLRPASGLQIWSNRHRLSIATFTPIVDSRACISERRQQEWLPPPIDGELDRVLCLCQCGCLLFPFLHVDIFLLDLSFPPV
ncbi:hypothetical protein ACMYSQ_008787 [Aspergillus niger]